MPAILISCCLSQIQWSIHAITSLILEPRIKVTLAFPYQRSNSVMVTTTNGVVQTMIIIHLNPTVTIAIAIGRLPQIVVYPSVVSNESCHHYGLPASSVQRALIHRLCASLGLMSLPDITIIFQVC